MTLSNYTQNAQKYLDNTPIIRGINGTELVDLVLKYYDQLSVKYRKMIPLKMVYIPVPPEESNWHLTEGQVRLLTILPIT